MPHHATLKDERGFAMLLGLFLLSAILMHSMVGLTRATGELLSAQRQAATLQAFHHAEAGVDLALAELLRGGADGAKTFSLAEGWTDAPGVACAAAGPCRQTFLLREAPIDVVVVGPNERRPVITADSAQGGATQRVEVVVERPEPSPFVGPIIGQDLISLASQVVVDSYDSSLGAYGAALAPADAVYGTINRSDVSNPASWQGTVWCDSTQPDTLILDTNAEIFGDALTAMDGVPSVVIDSYSAIVHGSQAPAPVPLALPPIVLPAGAPAGSVLTVPNATSVTVNLASCDCSSIVIEDGAQLLLHGDGTLHLDDLRVSGHASFHVDGDEVTLVVGGLETDSHATLGTAGGAVAIYGTGARPFNLQAQNDVNLGGDPGQFRLYVAGTQPVTLGTQGSFSGILYAPEADVSVDVQADLYGSIVGRRVTVGTHTRFHYDHELADLDEDTVPPTIESWRQP